MFTALTTAIATFLASRRIKAAAAALPYVVVGTPIVAFVASVLLGYYRDDNFGRVLLAMQVGNEAIIAAGLGLLGFAEASKS